MAGKGRFGKKAKAVWKAIRRARRISTLKREIGLTQHALDSAAKAMSEERLRLERYSLRGDRPKALAAFKMAGEFAQEVEELVERLEFLRRELDGLRRERRK